MAGDGPIPLFGVIGSPIGHSRSPVLHRAAYDALGFDASYDATEVGEGGLAAFLRASPAERRGVSVTMPLKREAWLVAASRDRAAELTGAVNTLVADPVGGWARATGSNTDVAGIVGALRGVGEHTIGHVLVIGAGATAASAVVAASDLGASSVTLAVRSPERAVATADLVRSLGMAAVIHPLAEVADVRADVVISTLPGGAAMPGLPTGSLRPGSVLLDVAYSPWPSVLVEYGLDRGAAVVHGLSMLVHQAARQVRLFAGLDDDAWAGAGDRVTRSMFDAVGLDPTGLVSRPS